MVLPTKIHFVSARPNTKYIVSAKFARTIKHHVNLCLKSKMLADHTGSE